MPFKSEAQRKFLWANHPEIAKEWSTKYGTPENLPEKLGKSKIASEKEKREAIKRRLKK